MASKKAAPLPETLSRMKADEVIAVLAEHWGDLSKAERDDYTHALLEHPDRVAIFDEVFRRAGLASRRGRN